MLTTYLGYKSISSNLDKNLSRTASEPAVSRESTYYLANIGKVASVDDFMKNDRLYRFAMKAFGLEDMTYAKGFMRKVLEGGVTDSSALANKLSDSRYKAFAAAFDFAQYGSAATSQSSAGQTVVDSYVRMTLEGEAGDDNEGTRLALYFQRKAPGIKSAYGILADSALLKVVQTAFGISTLTAKADIEKQASMITSKLKIADLQDPKKVDVFLKRFAAMYDAANTTSSTSDLVSTIFSGGSSSFGLSADQLLAIQKIRS